MEIWMVTALLLMTLVFLITEKIPIDLTAIGIIVVLALTGILTPIEAVAGFAHPAVITVGAMFLISRGMVRTGAVEFIGRRVIHYSGGSPAMALFIIIVTVAVASAFINNTPVVVLFIPVVMTMCCEFGLSPSKYLIPISYASILAGTCTLIGTSTNIIISDLSAQYGFEALTMFELSKVGLPIAVVGIVLLLGCAPRLMPALANPICEVKDGEHRRYLAELRVVVGSPLVNQPADDPFSGAYAGLDVLELIRYTHIFHPGRDQVHIAPDDVLLVKGRADHLVDMLSKKAVELPLSEKGLAFGVGKSDTIVVEIIIPPFSRLRGQRLTETRLMRDPDVHLIAIKRSGLHFTERQIKDARLKTGDIILVWCPFQKLEHLRRDPDCIIIEDVHHEIVHKRKATMALVIFMAMVVAATTGAVSIMVAALTAAFLMAITGCLQMRDAYRALQGSVLLLIVGTIALGTAMEKTGASRLYAEAFLSLLADTSPSVILGGIIALTSVSTQILSNNATAVLIFPIAVSLAGQLGVDPRPFIIGVCIGASACFATPIGYQTNLLVYGPGGYRASDYLKLGIPLNLMVLIMGTLFIPRIWPF
jgi:di/tricarboxylate transporter